MDSESCHWLYTRILGHTSLLRIIDWMRLIIVPILRPHLSSDTD